MTPSPSHSKHLPLQDVRIALGYVVVHALELGDISVNDGCDQPLGKLSVILAHHFGGTPWAWRNEASELDWGTAIGLLEQEMERMEEAEHGA